MVIDQRHIKIENNLPQIISTIIVQGKPLEVVFELIIFFKGLWHSDQCPLSS